MSQKELQAKLDRLFAEAKRWCAVWGISRLATDVNIAFSYETGLALGRLDLRTLEITLHGILLLPANEALLFETLCHELAHGAAALRYGPQIEEHGTEWREYMERAGFGPRPVIPAEMVKGSGQDSGSIPRVRIRKASRHRRDRPTRRHAIDPEEI